MSDVVQGFLGARANTERCHLTLTGSVLCERTLYNLKRGDAKHRPAFLWLLGTWLWTRLCDLLRRLPCDDPFGGSVGFACGQGLQ